MPVHSLTKLKEAVKKVAGKLAAEQNCKTSHKESIKNMKNK